MNITYQAIKPSAALQPYVDCYWMQEFDQLAGAEWSPVQRCLPFGMVELIVHLEEQCAEAFCDGEWQTLPRIFMAGMYHDAVLFRTNASAFTRKFGIRLKPETFHMLFKAPPAVLYSQYTELENILGRESEKLAEHLAAANHTADVIARTETFLLSQLSKHQDERNYLVEAARLIRSSRGSMSVEEISKSVYVSIRQLQRGFREVLGTSPKMYGRITRFRNAYLNMPKLEQQGGWAGLSYHLGYADQAHLIRDFKEFSGTIPNSMLSNTDQLYGRV